MQTRSLMMMVGAIALLETTILVPAQEIGQTTQKSVEVDTATWDFGNRAYAEEFREAYAFENTCSEPVTVTSDAGDARFLTVSSRIKAAPGVTSIPVTLTTPPWPEWPGCVNLKGTLVLSTLEDGRANGLCPASQRHIRVIVHVHWWDGRPPAPKLGSITEQTCLALWDSGAHAGGDRESTEARCLEPLRRIAADYRSWIDAAIEGQPEDSWAWLPSTAHIASMTIRELLLMKGRADRQLGVRTMGF